MKAGSVSDDVKHRIGGIHLDSHANMIVCGCDSIILSESGLTAEVNAFALECGVLDVPIVDVLCPMRMNIRGGGLPTSDEELPKCTINGPSPCTTIYYERSWFSG